MTTQEHWLCGPWVGEFGWELLHWQGYLRALSDRNRRVQFTVICETGHEYLYQDFAHSFIRRDSPLNGRNGYLNSDAEPFQRIDGYERYVRPFDTTRETQRFIRLGAGVIAAEFDVMVHARDTAKGGDLHKNWWESKWTDLVARLTDSGYTVGAFGSTSGAICPPGAVDLRSSSLRDICGSLAGTRFAMGTTSGPMELASLAGTPTLNWGGGDNADWTKKRWACSLFNTKFEVVSNNWQPSVNEVWAAVKAFDQW